MVANQSCATCKHAQWEYSKRKPSICLYKNGVCTAPIRLDTSGIPNCIYPAGGLMGILERSRHPIYPTHGEDCPTWERRSAK